MRRHPRCQPASIYPGEDELLPIARAFARARGRDPTFDELRALDAWATRTRVSGALLRLVVAGLALIDLGADGRPSFSCPGLADPTTH
jgi:hypothetical protein